MFQAREDTFEIYGSYIAGTGSYDWASRHCRRRYIISLLEMVTCFQRLEDGGTCRWYEDKYQMFQKIIVIDDTDRETQNGMGRMVLILARYSLQGIVCRFSSTHTSLLEAKMKVHACHRRSFSIKHQPVSEYPSQHFSVLSFHHRASSDTSPAFHDRL